eukprot:CAMPEP_0113684312 /NCGR_PEP_ID=MMETSP0038_2-20120614/13919_1 /TAXON_ID=2898 /ORGANISM="Cryptomonas paramecium" /LENGTH=55 /DNA_ID=CAMNT_0000604019 /DNA_START=1273 /DNA_END=1440 /DNA_ORIENTATION=+ /assembly_acc=CAM_ASM_000170
MSLGLGRKDARAHANARDGRLTDCKLIPKGLLAGVDAMVETNGSGAKEPEGQAFR